MTNQLSCTLSVLFGHYWLCTSFVIDRSLGTYKGPATLHSRPPLGLVAWRRNSRTVSAVPHTSYASVYLSNHWGGAGGGGLIPCYFLICPSSPTFILCLVPSSHLSSPREEGSEVFSGLRVGVNLALFHQKTAFYRPNKASDWSILTSRDFR